MALPAACSTAADREQITVRLLDLLAKPFRRAPRETAADRAAWLESAVRGMAAQAHHAQLAQLRTASRSFEAGETPAWVSSWATTAAGINEDLHNQLPTLRARSRNLARNNEWVKRYRIQLVDNVLGSAGIRLQMRLRLQHAAALPNRRARRPWPGGASRKPCMPLPLAQRRNIEQAMPCSAVFIAQSLHGAGARAVHLGGDHV